MREVKLDPNLAILFALCLTIYLVSPRCWLTDSGYTLLVGHQLTTQGTWTLDEHFEERPEGEWRIATMGGHRLSMYPPANPILGIPFLVVAETLGYPLLDSEGNFDYRRERTIQKVAAALIVAGTVVLLALVCQQYVSSGVSFWLCLSMGLGTSLWSSSSRVLWTHTYSGFILSLLLLMSTRRDRSVGVLFTLGYATLLSWLFFLRPSNGVFIVAFAVFFLFRFWRQAPLLIATGLGWLGLFISWSYAVWGAYLPYYYRQGSQLGLEGIGEHLAGLLFSPGRGLLVYSPMLLITVYLAVRGWRHRPDRPLARLCVASISLYVLLVASWPIWWGGHCYGPRLLVEIIPFATVLTAMGVAAISIKPAEGWANAFGLPRWGGWLSLTLVVVSVLIHAKGSIDVCAFKWNTWRNVDHNPVALWDWYDNSITTPLFMRDETLAVRDTERRAR